MIPHLPVPKRDRIFHVIHYVLQSVQTHKPTHEIVHNDRGNISYSQIGSDLGCPVVVHVLKAEIVVCEVRMVIVKSESK